MEEFFSKFMSFVVYLVNIIKDLVYQVTGGKSGAPMPTEAPADDQPEA